MSNKELLGTPIIFNSVKDPITLCEDSTSFIGLANQREFLEFKVKVSMFRFKFELYGYALNFCVKWNIPFKNIHREETWSIWIPPNGSVYFNEIGEKKVWE